MAKRRIELTEEDILTWADYIVGRSSRVTAERLKVSQQTIYNRRNRIKRFLRQHFDINEYRLPLFGMFPMVVQSLLNNLSKNDSRTTLAFLKGMGIFLDNNESLEKIADAIRDRGSGNPDVTVTVYNQLSEPERQQKLRNLARIYDRLAERPGPSDN